MSELIRRAMLELEKLKDKVYEKGFNNGFEFAAKNIEEQGSYTWLGIEEFTVPCAKCGKPRYSQAGVRIGRVRLSPY
ncbi:MAG: hypothetical protein QW805_05695 [Candidatus Bathyarchaeia archaeon]